MPDKINQTSIALYLESTHEMNPQYIFGVRTREKHRASWKDSEEVPIDKQLDQSSSISEKVPHNGLEVSLLSLPSLQQLRE